VNAADLAVTLDRLLPESQPTDLRLLERGARANVWRADLARGERLLLKQFPQRSVHAAREIAACARLRDSAAILPRVIAIETQERLVVFEYVRAARDLFQALRAYQPAAVMRDLGSLLGRLIVATQGPSESDGVAAEEAAALRAAWVRVEAWADTLNVVPPAGFAIAFDGLLAHHVVGGLRSLTQGDPAPSNVLFRDGQPALLTDFEYAAVRPALFDLAQWYVRCPLPDTWFGLLTDTLASTLGAAGVYRGDGDFGRDLARQASYAALYMFTWLPIERALTDDEPWVGAWRVRQALLSSATRGAAAAATLPELAPLAHWFGDLWDALARAWPESGSGALDWQSLVGRTG
jgi:hypothetical protein